MGRGDRGSEQAALVAEAVVDRNLGHARVGGDLLDRTGGETMLEEAGARSAEDGVALGLVSGPARPLGIVS